MRIREIYAKIEKRIHKRANNILKKKERIVSNMFQRESYSAEPFVLLSAVENKILCAACASI